MLKIETKEQIWLNTASKQPARVFLGRLKRSDATKIYYRRLGRYDE